MVRDATNFDFDVVNTYSQLVKQVHCTCTESRGIFIGLKCLIFTFDRGTRQFVIVSTNDT